MENINIDKLNSFKTIAENYGISIPMLKKLHANRHISVVKVGAKNFVKTSVIEKYIDDNTIEAGA